MFGASTAKCVLKSVHALTLIMHLILLKICMDMIMQNEVLLL